MNFRRLLPAEHLGDVSHRWADDGEGGGVIASTQDVGPALERNKALQTQDDGYTPEREMRRVAFIPEVVLQMWRNEGFDAFDKNNAKELARRLNSSDWAYLRTAPGCM